MITDTCFGDYGGIFSCLGVEVFGSLLIATIVFFGIVLFIMYKAGFNMTTGLPLGLVLVFSLFWITAEEPFKSLLLLVLFGSAIMLTISILRQLKR